MIRIARQNLACLFERPPVCCSANPMTFRFLIAPILLLGTSALALDGQVNIHDPSTVGQCDGKFYVWGTGGRALVSSDGWTWQAGATYGGGGLAPDVIHLHDRYCLYYAI